MSRSHTALVACLAAFALLLGGSEPRADDRALGRSHRIPYRISDSLHMVVRVKLNGAGPFNLIVDTGAPAMFVTSDVARQAKVRNGPDGWARFDSMEIEGGAKLENVRGRVEDIFQLRGMNGLGLAGMRLDGVIGYNILARYRMEYDLARPWMVWTELGFDPPLPAPLLGPRDGDSGMPAELNLVGTIAQSFGALLGRSPTPTAQVRGFLGFEVEDADGDVRVAAVLPGSPADEAGLEAGDVVRRFSDQEVDSIGRLVELADAVRAGQEVTIVVDRDDEEMEHTVQAEQGF